jgi:signal transduction histidine kinase
MVPHLNIDEYIEKAYFGRILHGDYSVRLKNQIRSYIAGHLALEMTGNPAIPYIAAWEEDSRNIWYEFAGQRFLKLFKCRGPELAEVFRNSIIDQRIYQYAESAIQKEIVKQAELQGTRKTFREKGKILGVVDAVYKISLRGQDNIWLKDLAKVITHKPDRITLSLGSITIVTKEMRAEQERLIRERLQVTLEMAGAVCHELNQPLQAASGHCETLLLNLEKSDPTYKKIDKILELIDKMGTITKQLMRITKYETKDYVSGVKIIDLEKSSR